MTNKTQNIELGFGEFCYTFLSWTRVWLHAALEQLHLNVIYGAVNIGDLNDADIVFEAMGIICTLILLFCN